MITVEPTELRARVDGGPAIHLPPQQCALLDLLVRARGRCVQADTICAALWPNPADEPAGGASRHIAVLVCLLRRKIGRGAIESVHGIGYRMAATALKETI